VSELVDNNRIFTEAELDALRRVKAAGLDLMHAILTFVPEGREASLAKAKVEESLFWALKGLTG
jgi:hypothetical protein